MRAIAPEAEAALREAGIAVRAPDDGVGLLTGVATVVKSPGVPQEAPVIVAARERGALVIGEVEFAWRLLPSRFIAVTGSNGKTTTTELIGHIFRTAGEPVAVAGNVGTAVTTLIGTLGQETTIVCEMSSFQLEDTLALAPEAAVLVNLGEDHLDRHGTVAAYHAAKLQAFARQPPTALAVAPAGQEVGGGARRVSFGEAGAGAGAGADLAHRDGALLWRGEPLMPASEVRLRGAHNRQNAMAAAAVSLAWGIAPGAVAEALRTFAGVPHRLEEIARIDGVLYVNDSKATNVDAAVTGVSAFAGGVHLILGGQGKGSSYAPLREPVGDRCAAVYLIGEEAPRIRAELAGAGPPLHDCGDLDHAVAAARAAAGTGDTVLLSPACASYDQFKDFEERGERFRALVTAG